MNCTKIGILKKSYQISLTRLLQSHDSWGLESDVTFDLRRNLPDQSLKRKFSEKQLSRLLVSSDLSGSNSPWSKSVTLLDRVLALVFGHWFLGLVEVLDRFLSPYVFVMSLGRVVRFSSHSLSSCHYNFLSKNWLKY